MKWSKYIYLAGLMFLSCFMILSPILEVAFGYSFSILNSYKFNNINLLEHVYVGYPRDFLADSLNCLFGRFRHDI